MSSQVMQWPRLLGPEEQEVLELTRRLLDAIAERDWEEYCQLCDEGLTSFEPEARGCLVEGLAFHQFYFDTRIAEVYGRSTICAPFVRMLGRDVALVAYVRITQRVKPDGTVASDRFEETRVWQRQADGGWRHVHFHRSAHG
ncbi:MAG: hypothetical protein KatS3mg110_4654 [Pirellulaceae bacterium]|nr:MAG: hypothetical protein KatS3mg110_4654 [Pirellulaceae bacterium]